MKRSKPAGKKLLGFHPHRAVVWTDAPARLLRGEELEDQFRHAFEARVFALEGEGDWPDSRPDPGTSLAHASWQVLRYDVLVNAGEDPLVFADDTSADLGHLSFLLLDDQGGLKEELKKELGETGMGGALLYIDEVDFRAGVDVYAMAVDLTEHIIRHYASGCFGAVYFRGVQEMPHVGLERALRFLGFRKVGEEPIYFANLEHPRPELPACD
jgi:hypothetical protein